jgi:hypothetical protein
MTNPGDSNQDELFRWADQIPAPLWDDLEARPSMESATAVNAVFENGAFKVPLLGFVYGVDPKNRSIIKEGDDAHRVSYQTGIVLLTTLAKSMGVPSSGRMVTPQELTGGTLFFTGAHTLATKPLIKRFGNNPEALIVRAMELGGERVDGADCGVRIPALPLLPLYVLLWAGDEESSARAIIGIDDRALFHLDLAGVFALTNIMVNRLVRNV